MERIIERISVEGQKEGVDWLTVGRLAEHVQFALWREKVRKETSKEQVCLDARGRRRNQGCSGVLISPVGDERNLSLRAC